MGNVAQKSWVEDLMVVYRWAALVYIVWFAKVQSRGTIKAVLPAANYYFGELTVYALLLLLFK